MTSQLAEHDHFVTHASADRSTRETIMRDEFRLWHYAGAVDYKCDGFVDKNTDLLFRDLKEAMNSSRNPLIAVLYPSVELEQQRRPPTAGTQFRKSMNELIDILMSKEPAYVRCIKPNHLKKSGLFDF